MKISYPSHFELLESAPDQIRVHVDYYNNDHKTKLTKPPYPTIIKKIGGTTIAIPTQDFLAYYLFWKQRQRPDLYGGLEAVKAAHLYEAAGELNNLITFGSGTLSSEAGIDEGNSATTGRLGEAMSLCVLNRIHKTGPGDWLALPEKRNQIPKGLNPMDFRIQTASDGKRIVQVECKGSFLPDDPTAINAAVRKHQRNIAKKKKSHEEVLEASSGIWQADLRYGTITTFGRPGTNDAQCWLLDPPAEGEGDPEIVKTLARLRYATNLLQLIAPRSHLTVAMVNRVTSLFEHTNLEAASGIALRHADGKSFADAFEDVRTHGSCASAFFNNRTTIRNYPAGGIITRRRKGPFLFFGMREDLLAFATLQKFEALRSYETKPTSIETSINAVIPSGQAAKMGLLKKHKQRGPYHREKFSGRLFVSSGGFVFGQVCPINS